MTLLRRPKSRRVAGGRSPSAVAGKSLQRPAAWPRRRASPSTPCSRYSRRLAALVSLYGLFADPATIRTNLGAVSGVVPGGGMDIIADQVHGLASKRRQALGFGAVHRDRHVALERQPGDQGAVRCAERRQWRERKARFPAAYRSHAAFTVGGILFVVLAMAAVVAVPDRPRASSAWAASPICCCACCAGRCCWWPWRRCSPASTGSGQAGSGRSGNGSAGAAASPPSLGWSCSIAILLVRQTFRQLRQDLWLARRRGRLHDLDLAVRHGDAGRRRAGCRDGASN